MKILYICTHNRCRSILSEAITNEIAGDVIEARSAGSQPAGIVHPLSLTYLKQTGYSTDGLCSQSWDDFEGFKPDVVITVCDAAAGETCPVYFNQSVRVHWGLQDPSKIEGDDMKVKEAFLACIDEIAQRVTKLQAIAMNNLSHDALTYALSNIGAR
ncbi:arsenate reductase ArsC [Ningiella sp. W23]|uniref:arsenate reductase ArsC n=1 Tax=Ningiella sp. W23 TaxID=3023715 RepID=UPI00375630A0